MPSKRGRRSRIRHEQIGRSYSRILIGILAVVGLSSATPAYGQQAAVVEVAMATKREVSAGQSVVGTVMPLRKAVIGSAVDGRVVEYPINEGDRVTRGQPLARLLSDTINLQIKGAEAELQLRQEELRELENGSRPEEVQQARAKMQAARAMMTYLQSKRQRAQTLFEKGQAITQEELQEAVAAAVAAEENLAEANAAYELAVKGPREEKIAQARARVAMQKTLVETYKDQLEKHTIISRFDGYITAEHTEIGEWVSQGQPVAEVVALDQVEIDVKVLEDYIPFVRLGSPVRVEVPALKYRTFTGRVASIVPQADVRARTFPVKIRVDNSIENGQPVLKAGMLTRMALPIAAPEQAVLVPKDAVVLGGPQPIVWVVDPASIHVVEGAVHGGEYRQGEVNMIPVEIGVAEGEFIQVSGAVHEGQFVVTEGNERLRPPRPNQPSVVTWPVRNSEVTGVAR